MVAEVMKIIDKICILTTDLYELRLELEIVFPKAELILFKIGQRWDILKLTIKG